MNHPRNPNIQRPKSSRTQQTPELREDYGLTATREPSPTPDDDDHPLHPPRALHPADDRPRPWLGIRYQKKPRSFSSSYEEKNHRDSTAISDQRSRSHQPRSESTKPASMSNGLSASNG